MVGREIKDEGAAGKKLEGADDSVKSNDKKAVDSARTFEQPKGDSKADPSTPAQYSF